jgi:ABC-2 type transport system permease protein
MPVLAELTVHRHPGLVVPRHIAARAIRSGVVWGLVFAAVVASSTYGFVTAYTTPEARALLARALEGNPGVQALFGVPHQIATVKGFGAWRSLGGLTLIGGVWAVLISTRLLRGEEDEGRAEVLLAGPTTRARATAGTLAGLAAGVATVYVIAVAAALLIGRGREYSFSTTACLFYGLALVATPLVFIAVGAFTSQLAATRRQAASIAGALFGAAYFTRVVADSGRTLRWLRWASPLGWAQGMRPLTGSRPAALIPVVGATAAFATAAFLLATRRDLGAGALPDRDHARARTRLLTGPLGLAARVTRSGTLTWLAALTATGLVFGIVTKSVSGATAGSRGLEEILARLGAKGGSGSIYLALAFVFIGGLVAFIAAGHAAATREEEASGRLDHLLVRPVSRVRWSVTRLAVAVGAVTAAGVIAGVAAWLGVASQHGGIALTRLLLAGVNVLPAALFVLGLGTLAHGVVPRATTAVVYGFVTWSFLIELLGTLVRANRYLLDLSVFHHVAAVPATDPRLPSAGLLLGLAAAAAATGVAAFARRDLVSR